MKKLLSITFFSGILTFLRMLSGFIIAKTVAIYTGPNGLAILGQVQSFASALNGVVSAPVSNGVIRYTAQYNDEGIFACSPWWKAATAWLFLLMLPVALILILFSAQISLLLFHEDGLEWVVIGSAVLLPFTSFNVYVASILNGRQEYKRYILLGIISVLFSTFIVIIYTSKDNYNGALLAGVIFPAVSGLIMCVGVIRQEWTKHKYWLGRVQKYHFNAIGAYVVMALVSATCTPIAQIIIRGFMSSTVGWNAVGYWQAVSKVSEAYLNIITIALSAYFLPKLSSLTTRLDIEKEIILTLKVILPTVVAMALSIYWLRDFILITLFTKSFLAARELFLIQLIGDVLKIACWIHAFPMLSRGATKWFVGTEVFFSIVLISMSYVLIKYYGLSGANIAQTLNYLFYFLFVKINFKKIIL